jgi:hypothetical protein
VNDERLKRKRQNKPAAMPKRSTKQRLKPQRAVKLKRKLALSWRNASASKRNSVRREKQEAEDGRNAKKAAAVEAERLKAKQAEEPAWPKRSESPMSRQSVKLT